MRRPRCYDRFFAPERIESSVISLFIILQTSPPAPPQPRERACTQATYFTTSLIRPPHYFDTIFMT